LTPKERRKNQEGWEAIKKRSVPLNRPLDAGTRATHDCNLVGLENARPKRPDCTRGGSHLCRGSPKNHGKYNQRKRRQNDRGGAWNPPRKQRSSAPRPFKRAVGTAPRPNPRGSAGRSQVDSARLSRTTRWTPQKTNTRKKQQGAGKRQTTFQEESKNTKTVEVQPGTTQMRIQRYGKEPSETPRARKVSVEKKKTSTSPPFRTRGGDAPAPPVSLERGRISKLQGQAPARQKNTMNP